ncbi:hypothetical protein CISIN_1g048699mg, partial [Citrus sinensis]
METSESLEEGLIPDPPFLVPRPVITNNEISNGSCLQESDSVATPAVVFSSLVAICGSFLMATHNGSLIDYFFQIGYSSPAESGITADLGLSVREDLLIEASLLLMTIGAISGSLINGKIADLTGQRCAMRLSDLFCILGWLAIAFSKQIPIYITEIAPKNVRGAYTATNQLLVASGLSVTYLVGTVVSCLVLALIAAVPCLLQVVGLFFIPEIAQSIIRRATIGKEKELDTTLQRLMGKTADISMESPDIRDYTKTFKNDSRAGIFYLFQRNYAYSLSVGVGLMVMQPLVGSAAIAYYASYIFAAAGKFTTF